jgi:hypothetical protein
LRSAEYVEFVVIQDEVDVEATFGGLVEGRLEDRGPSDVLDYDRSVFAGRGVRSTARSVAVFGASGKEHGGLRSGVGLAIVRLRGTSRIRRGDTRVAACSVRTSGSDHGRDLLMSGHDRLYAQ